MDSRAGSNSDNGKKLTIINSTGLQLEEHSNHDIASPTDNGQLTLLHPQCREMLAEMQSSIQIVGDSCDSSDDIAMLDSNGSDSNGPDSNVSDSNISDSSVSIRHMISTYNNKESSGISETFVSLEKDPDAPVFSTSLKEPIGPILRSALEPAVDHDIVKIPKEQQLPPTTNLQHRESISCGIEESTELLLVNSLECEDKYFGTSRNHSGTDSDIEVLMSDNIVDSNWSAGNTATEELGQTPVENIEALIIANALKRCSQKKVNVSENIKESTDQEISVGNSRCNSLSNGEQTGTNQLLKVISEQSTYIQSLESTINRYRETYKTLLEHVDALRLALDVKNIEEGKVKMGTNFLDPPTL